MANVTISGKFYGGEIKANGKVCIDGEFKGKSEGGEIEIGAGAQCSGELFYKEHISIARGATVEGQVCQIGKEIKEAKKLTDAKVVDIKPTVKSMHHSSRPAGQDI